MRRMMTALALVPVLALALPACGNGDGGRPAAAKTASDLDKLRAYAKCMRANGIDMEDPTEDGGIRVKMKGGGGEGGPGEGGPAKGLSEGDPTMKAAEGKCRKLRPDGGEMKKPSAAEVARMRDFAKCMRDNGVDMPDPDADGRVTVKSEKGAENDGPGPDNPKFKAAGKACAKFQPGRPGGGKG